MRHLLALLAAVMACTPIAAADTISLNNGDKITGTIEELNTTSVIVATPYAGRLTIDRTQIKTLRSDKPVTVVRGNDDKQQLFLSPATGDKGWVETVAYVPPPPAVPPRFTSYLSISPDWKNQASLGIITNTGNDNTTSFAGNLTFHYDHKPQELTLKFEGAYGLSNSRQTAGLFAETAVYRRDITGKLYGYVDDDIRYDAIKGISLQATATGGLGYWLSRTDKFKLDLRGGPGVTYLKTFDGREDTAPAAEGGIRAEYVFNERVSATHETTYTTSLTDMEVWRIHSETALNVKLDLERGLGLKLGFNDDYENRPATGRKNNDTRMMLSLTLDF